MGQRVYLPKDTQLNIGTLELSLATTNLSLRPDQRVAGVRHHGESYRRRKSGKLSRGIGLQGIYDGAQADAFKALQGQPAAATRLLFDKGHNDRIHAGMLLASDYELDADVDSDAIMVSGAAEFTGIVYIGSGNRTLAQTLVVDVAYDVAVIVVSVAGGEIPLMQGTITVSAAAGGKTWTKALALRDSTGVYIVELPALATDNSARPASGNWTVSLAATNYDANPTLGWGMVKPEGIF